MNLSEQVQSVILSNLRPTGNRLVGIEIECLVYDHHLRRIPVNPGPQFSATDLLAQLSLWQVNNKQCIHYSLEPGGQLEYASPPVIDLHVANTQYQQHLEQLLRICDQENLILLDYALEPLYKPEEVELIAQKKYQLMHNVFSKTGSHGSWMMRNTTSVQVNIDISSQRDAEQMAFIADCLEPITALLFAHAPFYNGKTAGTRNLRYNIWHDTDPARCGNLMDHGIISPDGLLGKYANWILSVPMIFAHDSNGEAIPYSGNMANWLQSRASTGIVPATDIQTVLHQIFTHVRFKHVLEVRGTDRPLCGNDMAPAAFWLGLLTAEVTRKKILDLLQSWSIETRTALNQAAAILNLQQVAPDGRFIDDWIGEVCDLALTGLDERAKELKIDSERGFLDNYLKEFFQIGPPAIYIQKLYKRSNLSLNKFVKTCAMAYE